MKYQSENHLIILHKVLQNLCLKCTKVRDRGKARSLSRILRQFAQIKRGKIVNGDVANGRCAFFQPALQTNSTSPLPTLINTTTRLIERVRMIFGRGFFTHLPCLSNAFLTNNSMQIAHCQRIMYI